MASEFVMRFESSEKSKPHDDEFVLVLAREGGRLVWAIASWSEEHQNWTADDSGEESWEPDVVKWAALPNSADVARDTGSSDRDE